MTGVENALIPETPLMRPRQVQRAKDEARRIDEMLRQPQHVLQNVDVPQAMRHRKALARQLHESEPAAPSEGERDALAKSEAELRKKIRAGMPTQAEMRRNPAGAVDKHRSWEKRNKKDILRWKNARLRMHAGNMLGDDVPADASDVANIETFRPAGGSDELNMHNCQIEGKSFFFPSGGIEPKNVASDDDRARWEKEKIELTAMLAAKGHSASADALVRLVGSEEGARKLIDEASKADQPAGTPPRQRPASAARIK